MIKNIQMEIISNTIMHISNIYEENIDFFIN